VKYDFGPQDALLEAACLVAIPTSLLLTVVVAGMLIL
jgi:hypothetical protein